MKRYILSRVLQAFVALVAISVLVFLLSRLSGNPVDLLVDITATSEQRAAVAEHLGLDKPLIAQYSLFMLHALKGDFGKSLRTERPVTELIRNRLPNTLKLGLTGMGISLLISLPIGVYSAVRRGGVIDFMARLFAVLGQSMPAFWLGIILIQIFSVALGWLPSAGMGGPANYILPAVTLGWYAAAGITRLTRSSMLDVLGSEYIKLARIKGVPEIKVIWKHAFKNALLPVLTFSAILLVMLLGGAVITETVFAWPGIGRLIVESVSYRDFPVVQTLVLMLSVMYIAANFVVDMLYAYVNPKIRHG